MAFRLRQRLAISVLLFLVVAGESSAQTVHGTVRLASTNAPVAYAIVVFSQGGSEKARTITDADGHYYVRYLPVGNYDVSIHRQNTTGKFNAQVPASGATFDFRVP